MGITITGYSDDLIEIEGDIEEEFVAFDAKNYLITSDGTVLSIIYDNDGIWRIHCIVAGIGDFRKDEGNVLDDTFDIAYLENVDIKWVLLGKDFYIKKEKL